MPTYSQYLVEEGIAEIALPGEKLAEGTNDLNVINKYGAKLFDTNKNFIREKLPDTWFIVIEPRSGTLVASPNPIQAYQYVSKKFPGKLMYVVGLLRDNPVNFVLEYA